MRSRGLGSSDEALPPRTLVPIGIAGLVVLAVAAWLSTVAINGNPLADPYEVTVRVPSGAPPLKDGDEVRIAGQRAGQVRRVDPGPDGGPRLRLQLEHGPVGRDARARVRLKGLAGAVAVELDPGDVSRPLPGGAELPAPAAAGSDLTDVLSAFDTPTRAAASASLRGYGTGLAGRGGDVGATLDDLGPAARDVTPLARAAVPAEGELAALTAAFDQVVRAPQPGPLRETVTGAADLFGAFGAREVDGLLRELPAVERSAAAALPAANAVLRDVGAAARELRPATRALGDALPSLRRALRRAPALDELAGTARTAVPVLQAAAPLVRELDVPARLLAPLLEPVAPLATYLAHYRREMFVAPDGFTRWGGFKFDEGQASGSRAVRFSMVLTCARARDPYPAPGAAEHQEQQCR